MTMGKWQASARASGRQVAAELQGYRKTEQQSHAGLGRLLWPKHRHGYVRAIACRDAPAGLAPAGGGRAGGERV